MNMSTPNTRTDNIHKNRFRRISACVLAALLILVPLTEAFSSGSSYIECICLPGHCDCFIQQGDEGNFVRKIIICLIEKGYLPKNTKKSVFSPEVTEAVMKFQEDHDLEPTGMMDDDTLTLLLWDMLPEELDQKMPIVHGNPSTYPDTVYIPTDGGKKRHFTPKCSRMHDPRKVSIRNAEKAGFGACRRPGCENDKEKKMH